MIGIPHGGQITADDRALIERIRAAAATAFDLPHDYQFFHLDRLVGESPDEMLLRMFRAEEAGQLEIGMRVTEIDVINALVNG
jgi:hypothetical protein